MNQPVARSGSTGDDDAAEMLALVQEQQLRVRRSVAASVPWILLSWAVAWIVGFGMLWLAAMSLVPTVVAVTVLAVVMAGAVVASAILGARTGRGTRASAHAGRVGAIYGSSWIVGFAGICGIGVALMRGGLPGELAVVYFASMPTVFVGVMYVVAGAVWNTLPPVWMGVWIVAVGAVSALVGFPVGFLLIAAGVGGVFLAAGIVALRWVRR